MNKMSLNFFVVGVIFILGCSQQIETAQETSLGVPAKGSEDVKEMVIVEEKEGETMEVVKEFTMTAKRFEFNPPTIRASKGDKVKIRITSTDVTHGFAIDEFGINVKLQPGKTGTIEFIADKKGTFTFYCSVFCGSGHGGMKGTLIVK